MTRTLADSLTLEGDLATEIATAVGATLSPEEKARAAAKPTDNPEAYELYVKARGREGAVNQSTEDIAAAEHLYEQAIALDPKFALAHARLSMMNSLLAHQPSANLIRRGKARAAAEEALRLAPSLGEARMALGVCLYWVDKDYAAALKGFPSPPPHRPMSPTSFISSVEFTKRKDAGVKQSQPLSAHKTVILVTAKSFFERPTITFLCVIGPARPRVQPRTRDRARFG